MRSALPRRRVLLASLVALAAVVATCAAAADPAATAGSAARVILTGKAVHAVAHTATKTRATTLRRAAVRRDRTAPTKPSRLRVVSTTQSTVTIAWAASTDRVGVVGYQLFRNDQRVGTTAQRSYTFASLACGTSYLLGVRAYDAAGNVSARALVVAATTACPDTQPPTQPSSVWQVAVTSSSVTLGWGAASDDFGVIGYEILSDGSLAGFTATTQYAVSDLACGTMHTLGVQALDAAGNRSPAASVLMATSPCPDSTAPSTPGQLVVRSSNETSVTLSWTPSSDNVGVVGYQVYRDAAAVGSTATSGYTVSGLACGKSYLIEVDAYDAAGNRSGKSARVVTTNACALPPAPAPGDTAAPSVPTGVTVSSTTSSSISLRWTASTDNVAVTGYGLYRDGVSVGSSTLTNGTFSGLVCGRSYQLAIDARDASGNRSAQAGIVASTSPCPDTQPPSVPPALTQAGATETTAWISWGASTDNVGVAGYGIYVAGVRVGSTSSRAYTFTTLACGTTYTVGVDAYDAAGIRSARADLVVATSACVDTASPSTPTGLATSGVTASSVSLAWNASTDNVGVTGYGIYRAGTRIDSSGSRTYIFAGLACGTTYALGVDAVDASGNRSAPATTNATTSACPAVDTQAPSTPAGLVVSGQTQTALTLSWNASSDNVGVIGYSIYRNGATAGTTLPATRTYTYSGLTCGTSYTLAVEARDAAGNLSARASVTGTTSACSPPPPPPPAAPAASLYLSPSGSDTAACTQAAPCRSFERAYAVAASGDTVSVASGVYPAQFFAGGTGSSQGGGSKALTFKGQPGNAVRQIHFRSPNLIFDGINVDAQMAMLGGSDGALFENGSAPFTFKNGSIGNVADRKGALVDGRGIVFDNVLFHDVVLKTSGVHTECAYLEVPEGMIIRNSTFRNCAVMDVFFKYPGLVVATRRPRTGT